jgi:manganese transport system ATP-binding protein
MPSPEPTRAALQGFAGIAVDHLSVGYNGRPAVVDVTLSLQAASICGLVGMNGAGKSTLFKALMGFLKPSSGSIRSAASWWPTYPRASRWTGTSPSASGTWR